MNTDADSRSLLDANRQYPSEAQRTAAWRAAFADDAGPFRAAFEHAAIGMAIVDIDGHFLKVNRALTEIVGYDEEELLARDFQSITHPDDLAADVHLSRQLVCGDISHFDLEKRYIHKDGHIVWILLSGSIARDGSGDPCYAIAQIQDITARKAAEQEAARNFRQMERLTETVWSILQAIASTPGPEMYTAVLRIAMQAFESPSGAFLRFTNGDTLCGPFLSPKGLRDSLRATRDGCELWYQSMAAEEVLVENSDREMVCGMTLSRSLVGPIVHNGRPLGVFHLGDAARDYDEGDKDLLLRVLSIIAPVLNARMERDKLSPREAEVMDLITAGMSQKQIATQLKISIQTTAKHRARVLEKLHLSNDVALVHLAMQMRVPWTAAVNGVKLPIVSPESSGPVRAAAKR